MTEPLLAVFDKKTGLFGRPFSCKHVGEAIRDWETLKKDPNNKYGQHPSDFELFEIGIFNETLGTVESIQPHKQLSSGV